MRYYEVTMSSVLTVPRAALFLAGLAAGAVAKIFMSGDEDQIRELKKSIADLQVRVANQEALQDTRLDQLEARVGAHEQRLNEVPSTSQIVAAMESLLAKTMTSLDARLSAQAQSIDVLKVTVSQTDELLEKVLESIDRLKHDEDETVFAGSR
jgi:uncharacterized coiled-coil protein SlyX